ncbi:LysR family transcriptional regulator ArgP [Megalodesulfovibrio paquesii]
MLDSRSLAALSAVVECGGFEKAAAILHLTQSAVSQRIKALEETLGQILLVRASPPVPTRAGQRLLAHWRQVRLLEEDLLRDIVPAESAHDPEAFTTLPIGVNADSLATWFLPALDEFLRTRRVLLDLRVDDQEATHALLRDGEVAGCISERDVPMQGCRVVPLGAMTYHLVAAPDFAARWFPRGLHAEAAARAPLLAFNRKDDLHNKLLRQALGNLPQTLRIVWLPSSEGFIRQILHGHACGMLPDAQCRDLLRTGALLNLAPGHRIRVPLAWHCWNLESPLLAALEMALLKGFAREAAQNTDEETTGCAGCS